MRAADKDECYLRSKLVEIAVVGQKPTPHARCRFEQNVLDEFFIENDSEFKFPATLREIDINHIVSIPFDDEFPIVPFRFGWFDKCRENLVKLRIHSNEFDENLMHFAAGDFKNLKELVLL